LQHGSGDSRPASGQWIIREISALDLRCKLHAEAAAERLFPESHSRVDRAKGKLIRRAQGALRAILSGGTVRIAVRSGSCADAHAENRVEIARLAVDTARDKVPRTLPNRRRIGTNAQTVGADLRIGVRCGAQSVVTLANRRRDARSISTQGKDAEQLLARSVASVAGEQRVFCGRSAAGTA
jgi:hypothetical protein